MARELGYAAALIVAGIFAIAIAPIAWRRAGSPGSKPLALLMLFVALWSLLYALHWLRVDAPNPFFWVDSTYIGVVAIPVCMLAFALQFTNRAQWLTRTRLLLLCIPPALTLIALWTDGWHHLFFGEVLRSPEIGTIFDGGPLFWTNVIYSYGLIFISLFLLVQAFFLARGLYRQQLAAVLIGVLVPLATNAASIMNYTPVPELDLTPIAFSITGALFFFALFRLGLLDVMPVARYTLVEEMGDGVLVVDAQNRIVDINPAAERLLSVLGPAPIGKPAIELLDPWPEIQEHFRGEVESRQQITLPAAPHTTLDLRISELRSSRDTLKGRLITMRDISDRVRIEEELRRANRRLQNQIDEVKKLRDQLREQAIRDPLTGLFNRRYLEESLGRELAKVKRDESPLGIAMLDIDYFKSFNDTHGHAAGDRMLQALADILQHNTRAGDIVCRYGGEEFVVVLPSAPLDVALLRIEYCRQTFGARVVEHAGERLQSTLSAGVASFPQHGGDVETLLAAADEAMYRAKQAGRDQVMGVS